MRKKIGEIASRQGSGLYTEGLLHTCPHRNHRYRDPHHESICTSLSSPSLSWEQQYERIVRGIEVIEEATGVGPRGLVPPQHIWNEDTLKAAWMADLNEVVTNATFPNMYPYMEREGEVKIIPSGSAKHGRTNNPVVHFYYDLIQKDWELFESIARTAVPLSEIPTGQKTIDHTVNQYAIQAAKQWRDLKRVAKHRYNRTQNDPDTATLSSQRQDQLEKHERSLGLR